MLVELIYVFGVFALSLGAVLLPLSDKVPDGIVTAVFRYFGAGVIVATGFFHLLAPAIEALDDVTGSFPLAIALCLVGFVLVLLVEIAIHRKTSGLHTHHHHGGHDSKINSRAEIASLLILETGIVVHSIFIGLSLAVSRSWALGIAIIFHQTFEGLGVGACIRVLDLSHKMVVFLSCLFALATPFGALLGSLIGSTEGQLLTGVCDALASGVTIYTGIIELVAGDMIYSESFAQQSVSACIFSVLALTGGMSAMGLLALWI